MPDIKLSDTESGQNPFHLRESELRKGIELLFFAYRDFTGGPDKILKSYEFGRAHHRVVHFVGCSPGISVSELLQILRITKQSLSRVLKQLIEEGFIEQRTGTQDRRRRLLYLTLQGLELEKKLSAPQQDCVTRAYREAGPEAVAGFAKVLAHLIDPEDREQILNSIMGRALK